MKEDEMRLIAKFIADVVKNSSDETFLKSTQNKVNALCEKFPLYS